MYERSDAEERPDADERSGSVSVSVFDERSASGAGGRFGSDERVAAEERSESDERFTATPHRWYVAAWVLFGLAPMVAAGFGDTGPVKWWAMGLPMVLGLGYALAWRFSAVAGVFPWVLVLGLGSVSYTRGGGASLFVMSLPLFWFTTRAVRAAVTLAGVAALATVVGGMAWHGRDADPLAGNVVATVLAYVLAALTAVSVRGYVEYSRERVIRLDAELEATRSELAQAFLRQGAIEERERLAREIHDTLAQGFASIIVLAEAARSGLETEPAASARQLLSIENTARENLAEARVLVGAAPRSGVVPGSVARALRRTLDRFAEDTGVTVEAALPDVECDQQTRIALLRCTQESLANVRKHAGASTVGVVLTAYPDGLVELEITDDGRGFVPADSHGFGLDGMRKRLAELGGEFTVTSSIGEGTRVLATIPTAERAGV